MRYRALHSEEPLRRPTEPPPLSFFEQPRKTAGDDTASIALGNLEIELSGLSPDLSLAIRERYAPYSGAGATTADPLRVRLVREPTDYFIDPPPSSELCEVLLACDGDRIRYQSYRIAGWFDTVGGEGLLVLAEGDYEPVIQAVENYVRSAVAWQAACRGGAFVHAASAVWNGAGYLFYGESGAGKSTLSECNRRARIVSDDLSLLLPGADGTLHLVGSPFRGTYEGGAPVQGSFPLRAGFRLVQAPAAKVGSVPRHRAMAELVGNLPFLAESFAARPDLFSRIARAFADIPLAHLHFRKDDDYWDAIASAGY